MGFSIENIVLGRFLGGALLLSMGVLRTTFGLTKAQLKNNRVNYTAKLCRSTAMNFALVAKILPVEKFCPPVFYTLANIFTSSFQPPSQNLSNASLQ